MFAKRYFGLLPIGNTKTTDQKGTAIFIFPKDLPGDTAGFVTLVVKCSDEIGDYGEGEATKKLQLGKPTHTQSLIDTRAMWTVSAQAPFWVIICYCGAVLLVIACLLYILNQLGLIHKLVKKIKM